MTKQWWCVWAVVVGAVLGTRGVWAAAPYPARLDRAGIQVRDLRSRYRTAHSGYVGNRANSWQANMRCSSCGRVVFEQLTQMLNPAAAHQEYLTERTTHPTMSPWGGPVPISGLGNEAVRIDFGDGAPQPNQYVFRRGTIVVYVMVDYHLRPGMALPQSDAAVPLARLIDQRLVRLGWG